MNINLNSLISISDINNNFSKASKIADKEGVAVILKNNQPKYVVLSFQDFEYYEQLKEELKRKEIIEKSADKILDKNLEAFMELAK